MGARGSHVLRGFAASLLLAGPADARMVAGGGPAASDCYAELEVAGIDTVQRHRKATCVDGDPCDTGPCGDGVCDFKVRLCWNQDDPEMPACVPPTRLDSLQLRGQLAAVLVMPDQFQGGACIGDYVDFAVATRGRRPGRMLVRMSARAPEGVVPQVDADTIRLVCVPRPFEECRMPSTPTTTVVPTTTIPGATSTTSTTVVTTTTEKGTTTTRRRKTTTTTTERSTTTTFVVPTTTTIALPTTTFVFPTTLPTITLPLPTTTQVAVTTTPSTTDTTTTTRRKGHGDDQDLLDLDVPLL